MRIRARRATGAVVLAAALAVVAQPAAEAERGSAAQAVPGRGAVYGAHVFGESPYPVVLRLNEHRTAVTRIVTAHHAACTSGLPFNLVDSSGGRTVIAPDGTFTAVREPAPFELDNGITAKARVTVSGSIKGRKVSGSVALHVVEEDRSGTVVASCDAAGSFRGESDPGRVYAGATSQHGPVVLELDRTRSQVAHLRVGWQSTCDSGAEFQVADHQTKFDIRRKRFGDRYEDDPYEIEGGGRGTDRYVVRGRILNRREATGTFRVRTSEVDAAGRPADACDSGRVSFRALSG